jgi:hypothetical protein
MEQEPGKSGIVKRLEYGINILYRTQDSIFISKVSPFEDPFPLIINSKNSFLLSEFENEDDVTDSLTISFSGQKSDMLDHQQFFSIETLSKYRVHSSSGHQELAITNLKGRLTIVPLQNKLFGYDIDTATFHTFGFIGTEKKKFTSFNSNNTSRGLISSNETNIVAVGKLDDSNLLLLTSKDEFVIRNISGDSKSLGGVEIEKLNVKGKLEIVHGRFVLAVHIHQRTGMLMGVIIDIRNTPLKLIWTDFILYSLIQSVENTDHSIQTQFDPIDRLRSNLIQNRYKFIGSYLMLKDTNFNVQFRIAILQIEIQKDKIICTQTTGV